MRKYIADWGGIESNASFHEVIDMIYSGNCGSWDRYTLFREVREVVNERGRQWFIDWYKKYKLSELIDTAFVKFDKLCREYDDGA